MKRSSRYVRNPLSLSVSFSSCLSLSPSSLSLCLSVSISLSIWIYLDWYPFLSLSPPFSLSLSLSLSFSLCIYFYSLILTNQVSSARLENRSLNQMKIVVSLSGIDPEPFTFRVGVQILLVDRLVKFVNLLPLISCYNFPSNSFCWPRAVKKGNLAWSWLLKILQVNEFNSGG